MISSKRELNEWLEYEFNRYHIPKNWRLYAFLGKESCILWKYQRLMRITEFHTNAGHKLLSIICQSRLFRLGNKYSMHIGINTCGKGLFLHHLGPVLVNNDARLGNDCDIHFQVVIGNDGKSELAPRIGNNVSLGASSTVLGSIELADGITVGANALVNKSFLNKGARIAGVPAKELN